MDLERYVSGLALEAPDPFGEQRRRDVTLSAQAEAAGPVQAAVDGSAVISFVDDVGVEERSDVLESLQLAQRAAGAKFDRFDKTEQWYGQFNEVMERVGWVLKETAHAEHDESEGDLRIDRHALKIVAAIASQNALGVLTAAISALEQARDTDGAITLFKRHATAGASGNFQVGAVERREGALTLAMGAFSFRSTGRRGRIIFGAWGSKDVKFWSIAQKLQLNGEQYGKVRRLVKERLGDPSGYIEALSLD